MQIIKTSIIRGRRAIMSNILANMRSINSQNISNAIMILARQHFSYNNLPVKVIGVYNDGTIKWDEYAKLTKIYDCEYIRKIEIYRNNLRYDIIITLDNGEAIGLLSGFEYEELWESHDIWCKTIFANFNCKGIKFLN